MQAAHIARKDRVVKYRGLFQTLKDHTTVTNIIILIGSICFSFLLFEFVLHLMTVPAKDAYGILFNKELPPRTIVPWSRVVNQVEEREKRYDQWANSLVVKGKNITFSDLNGIIKEDALIGYVPQENSISTNGWYQINSIGARSRIEYSYEKPKGKTRIVLFGESFTAGMRMPQDEIWAYHLNEKSEKIEVVNFGVGGYSMGQSYLRYQRLKDTLDYDKVILTLVPRSDLFREVNVIRYLGGGWESYKTNPRFVLHNGKLQLIKSPYGTLQEMIDENKAGMNPRLRQHLEKYDKFYYGKMHKEIPLFGESILYKLSLLCVFEYQKTSFMRIMMSPESEALQIVRNIFSSMYHDVIHHDREFILLVLPWQSDVKRYKKRPTFRKRWDQMIAFFDADPYKCIDLMDHFKDVDKEHLDYAYDATHYGPRGNELFADILWREFRDEILK